MLASAGIVSSGAEAYRRTQGLYAAIPPRHPWRMITRALAASALVLALAACSPPADTAKSPETKPDPAPAELPANPQADPTATASPDGGLQGGTDKWKEVASADDEDRFSRLEDAWKKSLREANHEFGAQIDALGMLAVPDAALDNPIPSPGRYRCRTIKIGTIIDGLKYVTYPWFTCTIELTPGGDLVLTKTTGSQRTKGLLYPDGANDRRLVYVGAQAWGDTETTFPAYGAQPERDQVGAFERIGNGRYRMVVAWPKQESKLDILELRQ